ncbi:hypothetical protein EJ110_NYTH35195 [Nymphaea thermarum]|nr:hypothetical protein EJ110_NYTH35195 [Nymphaea thermarum]
MAADGDLLKMELEAAHLLSEFGQLAQMKSRRQWKWGRQECRTMVQRRRAELLTRWTSQKGDEDEASRSALTAVRSKEEQIERKKMEVKERVQAQLGRVEEETKRLAEVKEYVVYLCCLRELDALTDPARREVSSIRKKIDIVSRELKPLAQACVKKEKEYKDALEAYNEKNREKSHLLTKLMEVSIKMPVFLEAKQLETKPIAISLLLSAGISSK